MGTSTLRKNKPLWSRTALWSCNFPSTGFPARLLKQWFDSVLTHGWAYGRKGGDKLTSRKVALAVSAGIKEEDYSRTGRYHYTLAELLVPFETAFRYCFADYRQFFALYGAEAENDDTYALTGEAIEKSVKEYLEFLDSLAGE